MPKAPPTKPDKIIIIPEDRYLIIGLDASTGIATVAWERGDAEIPDTVDQSQARQMKFVEDFFRPSILGDPAWGKDLDKLYMGMTLRGYFHKKVAGDSIRVSSVEFETICEIVRHPTRPYSPVVMSLLPEWFSAILEAQDAPPVEG